MKINTGNGTTIPFIIVAALWSLSLGVDLPGLAVTPMLDRLDTLFPDATQLKVQMLSVLPNLLIIPFVLLSGRLSMSRHKTAVIVTGLAMYLLAGVLYLFSTTMDELIILSVLLGCGCGLVLPFSTGLVADVFSGSARIRQMGVISGIGNGALVVATFVVGVLAAIDWHLPFLVYLLPVVSLALMPWVKKATELPAPDEKTFTDGVTQPMGTRTVEGFYIGRASGLVLSYFFFMYVVGVVPYYGPYLMTADRLDTTEIGTVIAVLYLGMFLSGMSLSVILRRCRQFSYVVACGLMAAGVAGFIVFHSMTLYCVCALLIGAGGGIVQPVIYDKATSIVDSPQRATLAMSVVLAANYLALSLLPEINDGLARLLGCKGEMFPFVSVLIAVGAVMVVSLWQRRRFVFAIEPSYYQ